MFWKYTANLQPKLQSNFIEITLRHECSPALKWVFSFLIECFSAPYSLDHDSNGGERFPSNFQDIPFIATENKPKESFFVELNLRNDNWLINCSYNFQKSLIDSHLDALTLSWQRPLSYRKQSIDLFCKSMDWFLYDNGLRLERVKKYFH